MAVKDVNPKCFILALFVRDDGERFLLGDGNYEFTAEQLHFSANTMANDVVEVQGNDGYLLAGQVRRPGVQSFDGYVGTGTTNKTDVETARKAFFAFFRKNYFYTVVYVFADGTAIQRKRGFLVDAPVAQELYQIYPKYHVALNFEDINYYQYDEDASGAEIYGKSAIINLTTTTGSGGLIWAPFDEVLMSGEGTSFSLSNTIDNKTLTSTQINGDTTQQTYSGKNLIDNTDVTYDFSNVSSSENHLSTLPTGIRYRTTYSGSGSPVVIFKLPIDLTQYIGKTIRLSANFGLKGKIVIVRINSDATSRTSITSSSTSGETISWTVPDSLGDQRYLGYNLTIDTPGGDFTVDFTDLIMTIDNADMTYEPYTGGIPAPNPDYPQTINTVTGRQVVGISDGGSESQEYEVNLGKNLFANNSTLDSGDYLNSNGSIANNSPWAITDYIPIEPNTTYTLSGATSGIGDLPSRCYYDKNKTYISGVKHGSTTNANKFTATSPDGAYYMKESIQSADIGTIQIEKGSTATTYAPYFEPIELCKIGTYQDYIYKSGSDWYIHKITNTAVLNGTENWVFTSDSAQPFRIQLSDAAQLAPDQATPPSIFANYYAPYRWNLNLKPDYGVTVATSNEGAAKTPAFRNINITTLADWKTWLNSHNTTVYYPLATATNTQITEPTLIGQLNALAGATTYDGQTVFTVTSDGNLAAILSIEVEVNGGGGVVWDSLGATWQESSGSGPTTVPITSIDNIYPIWTVIGPALNPKLSNITTGKTLSYTGNVTSGSTLVVDMFNKTAKLNGTSVIGNVSGDWVHFIPGNNRVAYTTNNSNAVPSKIEWQEIVG